MPVSPGHEDLFLSGFNIFIDHPIIGAGPQMYRVLCKDNQNYSVNGVCSTHVHNYYIQTMSELGIIGLFFLILLYIFLIKNFYNNLVISDKNYPLLSINLYLIISFLPIISHFNFYNNWVNPLLALGLGLFLYLNQNQKVI